MSQETPEPPLLRIVRGDPSPEELAALAVVIASLSTSQAPALPRAPRSQWSAPRRQVRRPLAAGPGEWRASALPR